LSEQGVVENVRVEDVVLADLKFANRWREASENGVVEFPRRQGCEIRAGSEKSEESRSSSIGAV